MPDREHGDEFRYVLEGREKKHHPEEKEQVVVAREHVACPKTDVLKITTVQHALSILLGDAMRDGHQGNQQEQGRSEPLQPER